MPENFVDLGSIVNQHGVVEVRRRKIEFVSATPLGLEAHFPKPFHLALAIVSWPIVWIMQATQDLVYTRSADAFVRGPCEIVLPRFQAGRVEHSGTLEEMEGHACTYKSLHRAEASGPPRLHHTPEQKRIQKMSWFSAISGSGVLTKVLRRNPL